MYKLLQSFVQRHKRLAQWPVRLQYLETLAPTNTAFFPVQHPTPSATPPLMSPQDPLHHFEGWTIADDLTSVSEEEDRRKIWIFIAVYLPFCSLAMWRMWTLPSVWSRLVSGEWWVVSGEWWEEQIMKVWKLQQFSKCNKRAKSFLSKLFLRQIPVAGSSSLGAAGWRMTLWPLSASRWDQVT